MSDTKASDEWIKELLKPLQNEEVEYQRQYNMLAEFHRRLHAVESHYAQIYAQVATLEKKIDQAAT